MSNTASAEVPKVSLADRLKRNVIVIGSTGVGKSTIINMLINQSSDKKSCLQPAKVGNTAAAVTRETSFYPSVKAQSTFVDTIGFGDPQMSDHEIACRTREFLDQGEIGIDAVVVVVKMGRLSKGDRLNLDIFNELFDRCWTKQSVLVITHYEGETDKEQQLKELEMWCGNDKVIRRFVDSFSKVIITDNDLGRNEESTRPLRKACLDEIQSSILAWEGKFGTNPYASLVNLRHIIQSSFKTIFFPAVLSIDLLKGVFNSIIRKPYCIGQCSICHKPIEIAKFIQTECNHSFHSECIMERLKVKEKTCPFCNTPIGVVYCQSIDCSIQAKCT